ncbi:uncharacterized protein LOC117242420 [Bombus vosnesenskii]|uniref:Uncharacterized protein LOC117242420 n=1 Tax=Bombus vosnesenskii TaxID=207650 RepID=A0A6J3LHR9_9HYME|nr:uncharacterized protein LOC117242420 [Bombus vosnesenskii]
MENLRTEETTEEEDLAEEMRTSTTADIGEELIRRAAEVTKVAETSRNLKGTQGKTLKEAVRTTAAGATEMVRRIDTASGALAIAQGRIATLEAEAEALRDSVSLAEIGINTMRMRKTITGGVILEIPENQEREKLAALAARLTRALNLNKVRVATPFRATEARVSMIDISATKEEIQNTLEKESGCKPEDVRLGEIRPARNGLGSVWIRGPAGAVRKLAQAGKVAIGWSTAKVEAIERRPLQCYRCLEIGHVRKSCTAKEDKGHLCFRCGKPGHQAKACTAASPKCLLCDALGAPSVHRMGGPICSPKKGTKGATSGFTAANGNKKSSPSQGDPKPVNKEAGTDEAREVTTLED